MNKNKYFKILISTSLFCSLAINVLAKSPGNYLDKDSIVEIKAEELVPKTLEIIYPEKIETIKEDTIYIAGTSNPSEPLYVNNQEIVDRASNGMFEVVLSLPQDGKYECVFSQGDVTKKVPVFKNIAVDKVYDNFAWERPILKNKFLLDGHMFPDQNIISKDKKIKLTCLAPSGASVTAEFCGVTFNLKQERATEETGVSARYSLDINLSDSLEDGKTYDLGNVIYKVDFEGEVAEKKSWGKIYYTDKKTPDFARVSWGYGILRDAPDCNENGVVSMLKKGITDKIIGEEKDFYQLGCGRWIGKKFVEPVFGNINLNNKITGVGFNRSERSEILSLKGNCAPVFTSGLTEDKLIIKLSSTDGNLDLSSLSGKSELFEEVVAENKENYLELIFSLKSDNSLWGYNIEFNEDTTFIYLKKRPELSKSSLKPLENITVLVDAGHGGSDPGAIGLVGELGGGKEKDINLANALAVKNRLISLGARVVLTRDKDEYVSLSDRAVLIEETKPDFVIVLHADVKENKDTNGLIVHCTGDNKFSKPFSTMLADIASEYTERKNCGAKITNFYVSRNTFCPTAFIEAGFLTNFTEASQMFTSEQVFDLANAVGDSIIKYLSE